MSRWPKRTLEERLREKFVVDSSGCWLWTGALNTHGYGSLRIGGRGVGAHRVSYELFVGPIPDGLQIDHLCRTPRCVNPGHLEVVTRQENLDRGIHANRSKSHCPQGHAYDVVTPRGRRCSVCLREQRRAYKRRQREKAAA